MNRLLLVGIIALLLPCVCTAQPRFDLVRIPTPAQRDSIPLYPEGSLPSSSEVERWGNLIGQLDPNTRIEGRIVRNVAIPTLTPVLPAAGKGTGAAVIIAPGGAFLSLSIDTEGLQIAKRLAEHGVAAFVLKYRTNPVPDDEAAFISMVGRVMGEAARPGGTQSITDANAVKDGLRALDVVRAHAAQWKIDPTKVGMMGFSAGAMTTLQTVLAAAPANEPAFMGYIYGPMGTASVPPGAPPMFAALALDDPLMGNKGFAIVQSWQAAHVPVEFHGYERGDHGFGPGRAGTTTMLWLDEFVAWLKLRGLAND